MDTRVRRVAFAVPLFVAFLSCATHQGFRAGYYRSSRPDAGTRTPFPLGADGYVALVDGIPTNADALHVRGLADFFRGAPPNERGIMDERPLVPLLQSLLFAGAIGGTWAGALVNLIAALAGTACAVDLALALGRRPLIAAACGCLVAGARGVGFYAGTPDVHLVALYWLPVGAWLHERLAVADPSTPRSRMLLFGIAAGVAGLTYLGDIALVLFAWVRGVRRTPLARLAAITAVAALVIAGWRVAGRAAGLRFDPYATSAISQGTRKLAREALECAAQAVTPTPESLRGGLLARPRAHANAFLGGARLFLDGPIRLLLKPIVPAFGWPLLLFAAAGFVLATPPERRLALALFLPPVLLAWPINVGWDAPRIAYPGVFGLLVVALPALDDLRAGVERLSRGERTAKVLGTSVVLLLVAAFLAHESSDLFSAPSAFRELHFGP